MKDFVEIDLTRVVEPTVQCKVGEAEFILCVMFVIFIFLFVAAALGG